MPASWPDPAAPDATSEGRSFLGYFDRGDTAGTVRPEDSILDFTPGCARSDIRDAEAGEDDNHGNDQQDTDTPRTARV